MAYTGRRTSPLPKGWTRKIRPRILRRDPTCQIAGPRCTVTSTEVDHKGAPDDHRPEMLQGVCSTCHASKTGREAAAARNGPPIQARTRPTEQHPGLTD